MPVQQQSMSCDLELLRYTHANKCQQQTVFDTVMANDGMIQMTLAARSWVPSSDVLRFRAAHLQNYSPIQYNHIPFWF